MIAQRAPRSVRLLLSALIAIAACSEPQIVRFSGSLPAGKTVTISNLRGDIAAYPPAVGQPGNQYTVEASVTDSATGQAPVRVTTTLAGLLIQNRSNSSVKLLARVPKGDNLMVRGTNSSVNIGDLDGYADVRTHNGNIHIQMPGYANAATVNGNVSVTLGSTSWPGTLQFQAQNGDVEVYVPAIVNARVTATSLHGTVFTDFPLPAHADPSGLMETAAGTLGSGGRGLKVLTHNGNIHLMKLVPQM